jgi:hypothetical protein
MIKKFKNKSKDAYAVRRRLWQRKIWLLPHNSPAKKWKNMISTANPSTRRPAGDAGTAR